MLKTARLILWVVLILAVVLPPGTAQATVQAGITSADAFTFRVSAKPSDSLGGVFSAVNVTVRWLTSANITLGSTSSGYGIGPAGGVGTDGSYSFQTFAGVPGATINWSAGSINELFKVPVQNATGPVTFELTNGPTGTEAYYFEFGGLDYTDYSTPFSPASTDLPLPITLTSFTATLLPNDEGVKIDWRTESEINNYGFYVQRRLDEEEEFSDLAEGFVPGHGTTTETHEYSYVDATGPAGVRHYRLKQMDLDSSVHFSEAITVDILTDVDEVAPPVFTLFQNYPNPFNPTTEIKFSVEKSGPATMRVYNVAGQLVRTLFDEVAEAGKYYRLRFEGKNLASGVYFYRLRTERNTNIKKLLLLK
ncbi:MAG: T9SS type A sorting domain-containing protein [Bacteroidetes bacterium]|nr:T9SS type A sorting domain-containing protein [Bacteroidota bacterium]